MKNKINYLLLFVALMGFSTMGIVTKTIIGGVPATQITFLRFFIGGLALIPLALWDMKKRKIHLTAKDYLKLAGLGILNVAVSMNLGNIGLKYTSANISAGLFGSNPVYVGIFAWFIVHEKMNWKKFCGLLLGMAGVFVIFAQAFFEATIDSLFVMGATCSIAGAVIYALYTVLGKSVAQKTGSLIYTAFTNLFGSIASMGILAAQGIRPFAFDYRSYWPQLLYISLFVTAFSFYCYFKVLETENASLASMVFFFKPAVVIVLSAILLHEPVTWNLIAGTIILLCGVYAAKKGSR